MISAKRIYEEFKSTSLFLSRRTAWALLILTLWLILKYFLFYKTYHWSENADIEYPLIFVIAALVSATDVFAKLRGSVSGIHYMLTPASVEEKYVSAWIYSTLYTFIIVFVLTSLTHMTCTLAGNAVTGADISLELMSLRELGTTFWAAMFTHSLFFLGSVIFKRNPVLKTFAAIIVTALIVSFITTWILKGVMDWDGHYSMNMSIGTGWEHIFESNAPMDLGHILETIAKVAYYSLPFVCWTGSFFILKHKQL